MDSGSTKPPVPFNLKSMSSRGFKYSADDINLHDFQEIQGDHNENAMGRSGMFGRKSADDELRQSMVSISDNSSDEWTGPFNGGPQPPVKPTGWIPSISPTKYFQELQTSYINKAKHSNPPPLQIVEPPKPTTIFGYTLGFKKWGADPTPPPRPSNAPPIRPGGSQGRDPSSSSY